VEILKYKNANRHGRKKVAGTASTGEASASGTILEPVGLVGAEKGGKPRRSKGESASASDKGGKKEGGHTSKGRDGKNPKSRKEPDRDDARKAKETADEKDLAEDEADKREYVALKNKMEARRIAREIQTAHDTLASLRAEQENVSAKTEIVSKARVESDRVKVGNVPGLKLERKKSRVNRPAIRANVGEPEVSSATKAPRRAEEQGKTKLMKTGDEKSAGIAVTSKRPVTKIGAKRTTSATEPPRTSFEKIVVQSSDEASMTQALDPALVAGALGRKIGDTRTATMMRGITECRVELLSTRQRAKLPVPAVPNNSAESNSVFVSYRSARTAGATRRCN